MNPLKEREPMEVLEDNLYRTRHELVETLRNNDMLRKTVTKMSEQIQTLEKTLKRKHESEIAEILQNLSHDLNEKDSDDLVKTPKRNCGEDYSLSF
jgi:hypothetical protein